jgi:hypothetical protein
MRFMTMVIPGIVLVASAMALTPASAQALPPAAQAQVMRSVDLAKAGCSREIKTYCARVKEGQGRLAACLYAYSDKMSDKCDDAIVKQAGVLNNVFAALSNAVVACDADIKRLCNGVAAGHGNLLGCLTKAKASVSAPCNTAIDAAALR